MLFIEQPPFFNINKYSPHLSLFGYFEKFLYLCIQIDNIMAEDNNNNNGEDILDDENLEQEEELGEGQHSDYKPADRFDASAVHHLSGM